MKYLGKKFGKEKNEIFADTDIFIHPTTEDCFPLVLLEAMSYGLPIDTTNEGGIPDIVNNGINGLISERNNPESLANCIRNLLDSLELRNKMGKDGYQRLQKYFTEEVFEKGIENILMSEVWER